MPNQIQAAIIEAATVNKTISNFIDTFIEIYNSNNFELLYPLKKASFKVEKIDENIEAYSISFKNPRKKVKDNSIRLYNFTSWCMDNAANKLNKSLKKNDFLFPSSTGNSLVIVVGSDSDYEEIRKFHPMPSIEAVKERVLTFKPDMEFPKSGTGTPAYIFKNHL